MFNDEFHVLKRAHLTLEAYISGTANTSYSGGTRKPPGPSLYLALPDNHPGKRQGQVVPVLN
jgi:hypothetical protein